MSDLFHHPSQAIPKTFNSDREIATALDAQFCFFRIGHAGRGSNDELVRATANVIGCLIGILDA